MGNEIHDRYKMARDIRKSVTDQDKVEMAGLGAYLTSEDTHKNGPLLAPNPNDNITPIKEVNGKKFLIENVHNDSKTGENYSVWTLIDDNGKPIEPIQSTFVVQGSNALPPSENRDAIDDANLTYRQTPEQYKKTLDAFNRINDERERQGIPRIRDVVGNSLGGGVANYIGYHAEGVSVISLNPATVPDIPKGEHPNVISVITDDDILNMLQSGMAYEKGGRQYNVSGRGWGSETLNGQTFQQLMNTALVYGHTGYSEMRDGSGYQIDNGALATSFLTGTLFTGSNGGGTPVFIDAVAIRNLVYSLMTKGNDQLQIVRKGVERVSELAENENNNLDNRISEVEEFFKCFLNEITLGFFGTGSNRVRELSAVSEMIGNFIRDVEVGISPLKETKTALTIASKIPKIGELFKKIEELVERIEKASGCVLTLPNNIALLVQASSNTLATVSIEVPKLFMNTHLSNSDGIPIAIKEYSSFLKDVNYPLIEAEYNNYLLSAIEIANTLEAMDYDLSLLLNELHLVEVDTSGLQRKLSETLQTPQSIQARKILVEKERQLDENFEAFCNEISKKIKYFSEIAYDVVIAVRVIIELIEAILKLMEIVSGLMNDIYHIEKTILDFCHIENALDSYKQVIDGFSVYVQNGVDTLNYWEHSDVYKISANILKDLSTQDNAHTLLTNMKPIVDIALFSVDNMLSVQLAANASLSLTRTLKTEFEGLMNEINVGSSVQSVRELKEGSKHMAENFRKFEEQIDVLAFE